MTSENWIESNQPLWFAAPRGSIAQQLAKQPRPDRHEHSQNLPPDPNFNLAQYPDQPLRQDLLDLLEASPLARFLQGPLLIRALDPHGWYVLNDRSLLPVLDAFGRFSDGNGRVLGGVVEADGPFEASTPSPVYLLSPQEPGILSNLPEVSPESGSFVANPWSQVAGPELATPVSTSASLASGAETVVAQSESDFGNLDCTNCDVSPVADRNFDVGVKPL
jgi:hypothetical protein